MDDFDSRLAVRDATDREMEMSRGATYVGDPTVIYLCMAISSAGSNVGKTTYLCVIVNMTNDETEGADLATDYGAGGSATLLATNLTDKRPTLAGSTNASVFPVHQISDRYVMEIW